MRAHAAIPAPRTPARPAALPAASNLATRPDALRLQRTCTCGTGECEECRRRKSPSLLQRQTTSLHASPPHAFESIRVTPTASPVATPTSALPITGPGDASEREADRIADAIVRGGTPGPGTAPATPAFRQGNPTNPPPAAASSGLADTVNRTPRHCHAGSDSLAGFAPPIVHQVLDSPGTPLPQSTRVRLEPALGHDLSRIRIHTDARAGDSARAVHAEAYTVGKDIVFAPGRFNPASSEGLHLLAHELVHTLQQDAAGPRLARREAAPADPVQAALRGDDDDARELTERRDFDRLRIDAEQAAILIIHLLKGATGDDDERAGIRILWKLGAEGTVEDCLASLRRQGRFNQLFDDYHGEEYAELLWALGMTVRRRDAKGWLLDFLIGLDGLDRREQRGVELVVRPGHATPADLDSLLLDPPRRLEALGRVVRLTEPRRTLEEAASLALGHRASRMTAAIDKEFEKAGQSSVAAGQRFADEAQGLRERAIATLAEEITAYREQVLEALRQNLDPARAAAINRAFQERLDTLLRDKRNEFGLELKYGIEFNQLVSSTAGRPWTARDLQRIDELLSRFPPDVLHLANDFSQIRLAGIDPKRAHLAGTGGSGKVTLFTARPGRIHGGTLAHEIGHLVHQSADDVYEAFRKISGWEQLSRADFNRIVPDSKQRSALLARLDALLAEDPHDEKSSASRRTEHDGFFYRPDRYTRDRFQRHRRDACFVTDYAATHPDDDFAESFEAYAVKAYGLSAPGAKPDDLREKCKAKHDFMHVRVFTELRLRRQQQRAEDNIDIVADELPGNTFGTAFRVRFLNPLVRDLRRDADAARARAVAEAERTRDLASAPPTPASDTASPNAPHLRKVRRLVALAQTPGAAFQACIDAIRSRKPSTPPAAYDAVLPVLRAFFARELVSLVAPQAANVLQDREPGPDPSFDTVTARAQAAAPLLPEYAPLVLIGTQLRERGEEIAEPASLINPYTTPDPAHEAALEKARAAGEMYEQLGARWIERLAESMLAGKPVRSIPKADITAIRAQLGKARAMPDTVPSPQAPPAKPTTPSQP